MAPDRPPSPNLPGDYYAAFRTVQNRLRTLPAGEILMEAIGRLRAQKRDDIGSLRMQPPWLLLLLLKWTVLFGDFAGPWRREFSKREFDHLVNLMHAVDLAAGQVLTLLET